MSWWPRILLMATTGASLAVAPLALAAPMDPFDDDWDPLTEVVKQVGGMQNFMGGPPNMAQTFVDQNFYFGSNLQAGHGGGATPGDPSNPGDPGQYPGDPGQYPGDPGQYPGDPGQYPGDPGQYPGDPGSGGAPNSGRCASMTAEPCASASQVYVAVNLPICTASRSTDCVESFYVSKEGGVEEAVFAEEWVGQDSYTFGPVATNNGSTPASGMVPLYRLSGTPHSGGDLYAVNVIIFQLLERQGSTWNRPLAKLSAQILPVVKAPFSDSVPACMDIGTISTSSTTCLDGRYRLPDEALGLRLNVSAEFGSFIFGRVIEPQITLTPAGGSVSIDVQGRPGVTPQTMAVVPAAQLTPGMLGYMPPPQMGTLMTSEDAGQIGSLDTWSAWNAATGGKALSLKRLWTFKSSVEKFTGLTQCIKEGEVAGWISTNSMVYEAAPPSWNAATGALDFKIGGPAQQPGGLPVSADYELFLRSEVASCVWPGQKVAQVATVSVIDGAGGEEVTSTSVGEGGGWVRFIARNVLFPSPAGATARAGTANPTVRVVVPKATAAEKFASCKVMWKKYKAGVMRTGAVNTVTVKGKKVVKPAKGKPFVSDDIYLANAGLDKDKDGLVCEKEPKVKG